jgi:hypothetical protein
MNANISDMRTVELWRRGQAGWPPRFPIAQLPNPPLLVALAGWGLSATTDGPAHRAGRVLLIAGIAVWASLEVSDGANWFRRGLGVAGLVWVAVRVAGEL